MAEADTFPRDVTLVVDGRVHTGWTGINIRRSLDAMTGSFNLSLTSRETTDAGLRFVRALAPCAVSCDGETLISGSVDRVSIALSGQDHSIEVAGRDRAADLVDCSAIAQPGSWKNTRLETIVGDLVKPFGVTVRFTAPSGPAIRRFALQQGETVQAAIERLCRFRALVAWSQPDGSLTIGNPAAGTPVGRLVEGEHFEELAIDHDVAERFSRYLVKGQSSGDDQASGKTVSQLNAQATDPAIDRYRPLIIIAEEQSDTAALGTRAQWEANVRAARAQTFRGTVPGWRDPAGKLWRPDTQVQIVAPSLDVDMVMLVVAAEMVRDDSGTRTLLELQRPEAWSQLPVPEAAETSALKGKK